MPEDNLALKSVFAGWDGHQLSLVHAIAPLTRKQLDWQPGHKLRSVGELAAHISLGRIDWFQRMPAPGSVELAQQVTAQKPQEAMAHDAVALVRWLEASWSMIEATLTQWTVADLTKTYRHAYQGQVYAISRQWTIWRIMAHDIHHGGELAVMLGLQGIRVPELGDLGGHISRPPLADPQ